MRIRLGISLFLSFLVAGMALGGTPDVDETANTLLQAFAAKDEATVQRLIPLDLPILRRDVGKARQKDVVYFALCVCDMAREYPADALLDITSACRLSPDNKGYAYYKALVLQMNRQPMAAREALLALRKKFADNSVTTSAMLATVDMGIQRYDEAEPIWRSLLAGETSPLDHAVVLTQLADIALHRGKYAVALDEVKQAETFSTAVIKIYSLRGEALLKSGHKEQSIATFDQALKINAQFEPVLYYKGVALERMGQRDAAKALYVQAQNDGIADGKAAGDQGDDHFLFGLIALRLGQTQNAHAQFDMAKRLGYTYEAPYLK